MAINSIVEKLKEPKYFEAFIDENMKNSTYKAEWKGECGDIEYQAAKVYQANLAETMAAMVGSVIDKNAEKPTHLMPSLEQLSGAIGRMGDKWQMDNDRLDQFYYLEGRYHNNKANYTEAQNVDEYRKLVQFLFQPFETAVIAPQKRLDMLYFEGLFKGTQTVSRINNAKASVSYTYDLGVKRFKAKIAAWGDATSTPINDIQEIEDYARAHGKTILKIRMSRGTFRKMCKSSQFLSAFTLKLNKVEVKPAAISAADVNAYLDSILLPNIVVEPDRFATLADGSTINLTVDDAVVFQCANRVAVMKGADPLEVVDPLPNKTYSRYDGNLVGSWRESSGRFIDYDMWATPVFTGYKDYYILNTNEVEA